MARRNGQKLYPFFYLCLCNMILHILPSKSGLFSTLWVRVSHATWFDQWDLSICDICRYLKSTWALGLTILLILGTLQLPSYKWSWDSLLDDNRNMAQLPHHSSQPPNHHQTCSWDHWLITDSWLNLAESRTAQLSPSQNGNPQNCEQIVDCCLKPLRFEEICYTAKADRHILLSIPLTPFRGSSMLSTSCLSLASSAHF